MKNIDPDKIKTNKSFSLSLTVQNKLKEVSLDTMISQNNLVSSAIEEIYHKWQSCEKMTFVAPALPDPIVSNSDTGEPVDKEEIKRPGGEIKRLAGAIYDHYMKVFNKDPRYKLTPDRLAAIRARLDEGFTMVECKEHIDFIAASPFHNGDNKEGKIHTDLKDIIFNKTKFHKRIDEITQNRPKVIKKVKDEKAEEALMAERYRKEEEEYFKRKKLNAEV